MLDRERPTERPADPLRSDIDLDRLDRIAADRDRCRGRGRGRASAKRGANGSKRQRVQDQASSSSSSSSSSNGENDDADAVDRHDPEGSVLATCVGTKQIIITKM